MSVPPKELVGVCLNIMSEIRKTIERYEKRLDKVYQQAGGKSTTYTAEGKNKRRRKMSNAERKDPDRVKKPRSTYIRFVMETRPLVESEIPGISQAELMKELGKRWKELPDDQREEYKVQYEDEKRRIIEQAKGGWIGEEDDLEMEESDHMEEGDPMEDEDDGEGHELDEDEATKRQRIDEYHEHMAQTQLMQQQQAQLQHHHHLMQQQHHMGMMAGMQVDPPTLQQIQEHQMAERHHHHHALAQELQHQPGEDLPGLMQLQQHQDEAEVYKDEHGI